MSANKVICQRCRGRKSISAMGGLTKECPGCLGVGKVEAPKVMAVPTMSNEPIANADMFPVDSVDISKKHVDKIELCSLEDIFPGVTEGVKAQEIEPKKKEQEKPKQLWPGLDDDFVLAILDEPRMDPMAWAAKYKHVSRLFGAHMVTGQHGELMSKVQRNTMRLMFAQSQIAAPRKVDIMSGMDAIADKDPEYQRYAKKVTEA